ncbi:DUF4905 domain-containing protein [Pontibacter sp. 172403-2]|nr:DUF4905 domain-containing protein [Pontibacter sp. 172403-2]
MWRIRIDAAAGRLALEVRDADVLLAFFYTFDCQGHTLQQLSLPQALTWWQGLEDAHAGLVYLHGYADRQLGQHKGITALNAATDKIQWEAADLAFYGLSDEGIMAHPAAAPGEDFVLLNSATGQIIRKQITQQAAAAAAEKFSHSRYQACIYPILYREGEAYFTQVQAFVEAQLGQTPVSAIEYAEAGEMLVVSFYTPATDGKLDNYLAVFNFEGDLLLNTTLGSGLSGIGSDTFFIFKHKLYFIQNKDSLHVYALLL